MGRIIDWILSPNCWLLFLLGTVLLLYVIWPLLVWQTQRMTARNMYAVMPEALPAKVVDFFRAMSPPLAARGFQVAAYVRDPQEQVEIFAALWVNRTCGQVAIVGMVIGLNSMSMAKWVEFVTELPDGTTVVTNNLSNLGIFVLPKIYHRLQFPQVDDPEKLYRLHLWHESRWLNPQMPRFLAPVGTEMEWLAHENLRTFKRQVAAGRMIEEDGVFRPTFVQAFRATWMQCPPVLQIRKLRAWVMGKINLRWALAGPRQAMAVRVTEVPPLDVAELR
jgi:hypothetical protein